MEIKRIALIGSGISSGGLVSMLRDFLSYRPEGNYEITLFCSKEFAHHYPTLHPSIKVEITDHLRESRLSMIVSTKYKKAFIQQIDNYNPDAVFFISGSSKDGLDHYVTYIVLNNQLYTNIRRIFKQKSLKVILTTLIYAFKFRRRARHITHFFFSSEYSKKESESVLKIHDSKVVPFACNKSFYLETPIIKEKKGNLLYLLNIGSFIPYKNQLVVIEALKLLKEKNVRFKQIFIGRVLSSRYYEQCIRKIKAYGLSDNVEIIEWLEQEKVIEQIDACDIYINSSETDTCATSAEEGMARCKPVIASNTLFNKEMVRDGGLYFDLESPITLAEAIVAYANNDALKREKAIKGYEISKKWTLLNTSQSYYQYIIENLRLNEK